MIVLGNEKGGSGKSTTAMHIAVALLKAGQRVATIDLDSRQKSFTHYVENRRAWAKRAGIDSSSDPLPRRARQRRAVDENEAAEFAGFAEAITAVEHSHDFVVIDTPGERQLPDAARPFDGRHAGHAAQRQLRRFRRARHRRSDHLRGDRREPLCARWCARRGASAASSTAA